MPAPTIRRTRLALSVSSLLTFAAGGWILLGGSTLAHAAQPGGGVGGGMGGPGQPMNPGGGGTGPKEDKDGPAEEAPKDKQALRPIEPVPAEPKVKRRLQFFELHGYMRTRADFFHRLHLNIDSDVNPDQKYFTPPAQVDETDAEGVLKSNDAHCGNRLVANGVSLAKASSRCNRRHGIGSGNLRLRLEPTLHVSDTVKVHAQVDLLDNLVLGSTPDSYGGEDPYAPIDLYTRTQNPPSAGVNSFQDSVSVKQAYGHIHFGWGLDMRFGRMPNQWGLGILANDGGGYSRLEHGDIVRDLDADYGDSVDSVRLAFGFGKDKRRTVDLGVSYDWAASGPTISQLLGPAWSSGKTTGQDFSAEKYDNVYQFSVFVERRDDPAMLLRKLSLGGPVVNYGAKAWLRWQDVDRAIGSPGLGDGLGGDPLDTTATDPNGLHHDGATLGNGSLDAEGDSGYQNYAEVLVHRRAFVFTPDLWLRVNWRTLRVEVEGAAVFGSFQHRDLASLPGTSGYDPTNAVVSDESIIRQGGYALEFKYGLFDDRFHIGLDQGFASGDPTPNVAFNPQSPYLQQNGVGGSGVDDNVNEAFRFNPGYIRDLLLFREILGTTSNAVYFKPWTAFYFFQRNASIRLDIEYAFAPERTATLGAKHGYGLEIDAAVRYHDVREPIFVQLQYGVMFPFKAFQPANSDAKGAQTIQAQVGIKF